MAPRISHVVGTRERYMGTPFSAAANAKVETIAAGYTYNKISNVAQ